MKTIVNLYSMQENEIKKFLDKYYERNVEIQDNLEWSKAYDNPIEIADIIGIFIDNSEHFNITMWISLDKGLYININNYNSDKIIRYLFERYPY